SNPRGWSQIMEGMLFETQVPLHNPEPMWAPYFSDRRPVRGRPPAEYGGVCERGGTGQGGVKFNRVETETMVKNDKAAVSHARAEAERSAEVSTSQQAIAVVAIREKVDQADKALAESTKKVSDLEKRIEQGILGGVDVSGLESEHEE